MHDAVQIDTRRLPADIARHARPPSVDPRVDLDVAGLQRDDRVIARTTSPHVIVCLPASAFPSVEDGVPLFSEISNMEGSQSIGDIETCLGAVQTYLEPTFGPAGCFYSVRGRSVQSTSNTPGRFLADLTSVEEWATAIEDATKTQATRSHVFDTVGFCLWETSEGWFFLEATQREADETFALSYGLLRYGPPLDATAIASFFQTTTETPPNTFAHCPLRQLHLLGGRELPIDRLESTGEAFRSDPDGSALLPVFRGENPLFGVHQQAAGLTDVETNDLYQVLASVSSLPYNSETLDYGTGDYHLKRIVAMDPPCSRTVFATATVAVTWGC